MTVQHTRPAKRAANGASKSADLSAAQASLGMEEDDFGACWQDERDQEFNAKIHHMLIDAENAIDTEGALDSIRRALGVVDDIRAELIAEQAFRSQEASHA